MELGDVLLGEISPLPMDGITESVLDTLNLMAESLHIILDELPTRCFHQREKMGLQLGLGSSQADDFRTKIGRHGSHLVEGLTLTQSIEELSGYYAKQESPMIDWIGITVFDPATGEYANISVRRTKAGKPNKTDLRRFVRKRSIPRRFIQHGLRMLNPDEDWPPEYVWEGDPPDVTPHLGTSIREAMLAGGFMDEW